MMSSHSSSSRKSGISEKEKKKNYKNTEFKREWQSTMTYSVNCVSNLRYSLLDLGFFSYFDYVSSKSYLHQQVSDQAKRSSNQVMHQQTSDARSSIKNAQISVFIFNMECCSLYDIQSDLLEKGTILDKITGTKECHTLFVNVLTYKRVNDGQSCSMGFAIHPALFS